MEKVLNQDEIDGMVQLARGGKAAQSPGTEVKPWDLQLAGQIGREKLQSITALHETFARNLTHALGAYLRIRFEAALVSAEHLSYREFLQRLPEASYLASCKMAPMAATALLQMDMAVAFPLIDLLLGGEGKGQAPGRAMSTIEEQILEGIVRIVCRELALSWQAISLQFTFDQRQDATQAARLMDPKDRTLALSFEINILESRGTINLAIPTVASHALLRKITAAWAYQKPRMPSEAGQKLRRRLLQCSFPVELNMIAIPVPLRQLVALSPGQLLVLQKEVAAPATLRVAGHPMFLANLARRADLRVAHLRNAIETEGKEET